MNREYISEAVGGISDRYVTAGHRRRRRRAWGAAVAAVLAAALMIGVIALMPGRAGVAVTAYAAMTGQQLTGAGSAMTTGSISDDGVLTGHPLMFYITGEGIESVRFSCKNQVMNFTDLTERRDGYALAGNFTVPYGGDTSQYSFLILDWVPQGIIERLRDGVYGSVAEIPDELRRDVIVMEVTGSDGGTAVMAVNVELRDDGTFFASFGDYRIGSGDDFVRRPDAKPVERPEAREDCAVTVTVLGPDGEPAVEEALWYTLGDIGSVRVSWTGGPVTMVQMFACPTGTETLEYMELLATKVVNPWDREPVDHVDFPAEALAGLEMDHVWFVLETETGSVTTEMFNVVE